MRTHIAAHVTWHGPRNQLLVFNASKEITIKVPSCPCCDGLAGCGEEHHSRLTLVAKLRDVHGLNHTDRRGVEVLTLTNRDYTTRCAPPTSLHGHLAEDLQAVEKRASTYLGLWMPKARPNPFIAARRAVVLQLRLLDARWVALRRAAQCTSKSVQNTSVDRMLWLSLVDQAAHR